MAVLKNKRKQEIKIEQLDKEVEVSEKYLTKEEKEVLEEQHENDLEDLKKVSTAKMEKAVEVVQDVFHLSEGNFIVTGFADKGGKCLLSLANADFDISVLVKDAEKYNII